MFGIEKKILQYPRVTNEYPYQPANTDFLTGEPVIEAARCNLCRECSRRCPSGAIVPDEKKENMGINLDECIFCSLCAEVCPRQAIFMSKKFESAEKSRDALRKTPIIIKEEYVPDEKFETIGMRIEERAKKFFGRSIAIREVDAGSCNGCDNEVISLGNPLNDIERFGIQFVASPRHADILLVSGPLARNMELALVKTYNATPDPKLVIALGACACSGGIFKDSYATKNGIDRVLPVDVYIPGCPPRPQSIIYGILLALDLIRKEQTEESNISKHR